MEYSEPTELTEPSTELTEPPEPPTLSRRNTTMSPTQAHENTCVPHMISRLFIRNIFNLPGMLNTECNQFLDTYEFSQIGEIGSVSVEYVSLKNLLINCKNKESVRKVVMYLYIYFLIIEKYPTICSDGISAPHIEHIYEIIHYVTDQINDKHIPKKVEQYESVITSILEEKGQIHVTIYLETMIDKQTLSQKFVKHMKKYEYVGCLMYSTKGNHATIVGSIGCNTEEDGMLTIKDSEGVSNTCILIDDFLTSKYKGYKLNYFIYLSLTRGGNSKRKKKLNRKSRRKHKQ